VQLRPTVKPIGKALEFDRSLFERLYTGPLYRLLSKTMLRVSDHLHLIPFPRKTAHRYFQTQYRFSEAVAKFPSTEFYEGRLETGSRLDEAIASLARSSFPWPVIEHKVSPVIFVPCTSEEDRGRSSKSNLGQVNLVKYILNLLRTPTETLQSDTERPSNEELSNNLRQISIAILTPYSRQVKLLQENIKLGENTVVSTIDGFQGREADIVVFTTVRSNIEGDLGFLDDERRLNVAWTRPKLALILVGDKRTLGTNGLWKRAIDACQEVVIERPVEDADAVHTR
jgi:superfamily I DNA and/or RNA helicase